MAIAINTKAFVPPHDPILTAIAEEVLDIQSEETKGIIERMLQVALGEQTDPMKSVLVGLAAPQVGISKRIILVDVKANGKGLKGDLQVYINPEIVFTSDEKEEWYEGCYSTGKVCGIVARPKYITIQAYKPDGTKVTERHIGYTARIFQHEIDHLDGWRFPERITDPKKLHWVESHQYPEYRDQGGWQNWPHICSRDVWLKIKSGKE